MSFSVVIPARNREALVARAVASALRQTTPPREVVVADDGSTDGTVAAARAAGAVVVESAVSTGSGPARNRGVAATTGDWVAFLDSDDEWDPHHLATLDRLRPGQVLVSAGSRTASGADHGLGRDEPVGLTPAGIFTQLNPLTTSGTAVERRALDTVGGFRDLPRAQDFDCWLRVLERGPGVLTDARTVIYHEHPGQVSRSGDLNRRCVLWIIDDMAGHPWCTRRVRADALGRFFVSDLRVGGRNRQPDRIVKSAAGLVRRPSSWPAVGRIALARARRLSDPA